MNIHPCPSPRPHSPAPISSASERRRDVPTDALHCLRCRHGCTRRRLLELATLFGSGKGIKIVIVRSERAASPQPGPPSLQQNLPQQQQLPPHALKSFVDKLLHLARSAGVSVREISEMRQTDGVRKVSIDDTKRHRDDVFFFFFFFVYFTFVGWSFVFVRVRISK